MDPNWFYSTMSQSTAALVGFLGAILLAKLMDHKNSSDLANERQTLGDSLGAWRHNALVHAHNALTRHQSKRLEFEKVLALLEDDAAFRSAGRFNRLTGRLRALMRPVQAGLPDDLDVASLSGDVRGAMELWIHWQFYNGRIVPNALYLIMLFLVVFGWFGVVVPVGRLSGFDPWLYRGFQVGYVLLALAVLWLLLDAYRTSRVRPSKDPNYLVRRPKQT